MKRLYNLDYLRGLAAFGIMIYHYLSWSVGTFEADSFMGRLGIYGVSIFYILSGLTLYYVYYKKMKPSKKEVVLFFKKRIFRIFPLLWLVTIIAIIFSRKLPDITNLILNLTGLFGFLRWDQYFSAGVWSIGNELVFYVFFPFFIFFMKKHKPLMVLLSLSIIGLYLYFAFYALTPEKTLSEQWRDYIHPLNQVFLFLSGFLMGYFFDKIKLQNYIIFIFIWIGILGFTFYPVSGDAINLVTGVNRLIFTLCSFLICFGFYKLNINVPSVVHTPLALLGETSYSIYLLHPIVYSFIAYATGIFSEYAFEFPRAAQLPLSVIITLVMSYFVYQYVEKYFMKYGQSMTKSSEAKSA